MLHVVESFLRDINFHLCGYCIVSPTKQKGHLCNNFDYDPILSVFVSVICEHVCVSCLFGVVFRGGSVPDGYVTVTLFLVLQGESALKHI